MIARTPPAFIPTLTRELGEGEVAAVQAAPLLIDVPLLDEEVLPPEALHALPSKAAAPLFMPSVSLDIGTAIPSDNTPTAVPPAPPTPAPARAGIDDSASQAEQMRSRLLQRVDVIVQRRVREAAAAIALEHAQNLLQDLRPALEKAIAEAVNEALALEVHSRPSTH